jgi:hypothetical protein
VCIEEGGHHFYTPGGLLAVYLCESTSTNAAMSNEFKQRGKIKKLGLDFSTYLSYKLKRSYIYSRYISCMHTCGIGVYKYSVNLKTFLFCNYYSM